VEIVGICAISDIMLVSVFGTISVIVATSRLIPNDNPGRRQTSERVIRELEVRVTRNFLLLLFVKDVSRETEFCVRHLDGMFSGGF
jgi:hypothetical protein